MTMELWKRFGGVGLLSAAALGVWLAVPGRETAEAALPTTVGADVRGARVDAYDDIAFWWTAASAASTACIWFGPFVEYEAGVLHRQWTLVLSDPGATEPLACLQGVVEIGNADPIAYQGVAAHIEARPIEGLMWGEVTADDMVSVVVEGLL